MLSGVASAASCVFPAAASAGVKGYLAGATEAQAAGNIVVGEMVGPHALHYFPNEITFSVLAMLPPEVWVPRNHTAIAAAIHKRWPKMAAPSDTAGQPWLAQIRLGDKTEWIGGSYAIDAPSLGGALQYGPTTCTP